MSAKHQSLQEWHAAGGGVPVRFKGKEHIWHKQVEQHLSIGGELAKVAAKSAKPAAKAVTKVAEAAPQAEALRLAQQRAALPPAKGGLGLPANNTPEQRAAAMGFNKDTYHGTFRDVKKLDPSRGSTESHAGKGVYSTDSPKDASLNYASIYGPDVGAKVGRTMDEMEKDWRRIHSRMKDETLTPRQQEIILQNTVGADNLGVVYPLKVRADKPIHLDAPEANPVRIGPFEHYDEVADAYVDTPHTAKFNEALDEFRELGGEANPIYELVQDYGDAIPARDVFNAVKKTGSESGLYDPFTGDIVSGGVAAGDFMKHFGVDEISHTPRFNAHELNIGNEHTISLNPDNVRSRFAAFDPFRKTAATAAAMGVAAPDLLAKDKKDKKKAQGGAIHLAGGGDPRKRAMYPKMPTQAIIESEGFDPDVPSDLSRAYARRMADKAEYERNIKDQKLTPTQRGVAGLEAAGMLGSAMFEGVQQLPKLLDSQEAYEQAVGKGMYQPRFQPEKAAEYVGNVSDFLEQLETKYKMPQVLPELLGMAPLADAAKRQAGKAVKQGALTAASRMDAGPKSGSMAAQRGAVKLGGGNWVDSETNRVIGKLKADESYPQSAIASAKEDLEQANKDFSASGKQRYADYATQLQADIAHMEEVNAYNKWLDTKVGGYIRNQMATPDDPVVKMLDARAAKIESDYATGQKRLAKLDERIAQAEATASTTEERNNLANMKRTRAQRAAEVESDRELAMSAMLPSGKDYAGYDYLKNNAADLIYQREKAGFPIAGYAQSEPAKAWEAAQDMNVVVRPAEIFQNQEEKLAAVRAADKELNHYLNVELPDKFREHITQKDLPDAEKQDLIDKMPKNLMAHMIGDKEKRDLLNQAYYQAREKADASAFAMAEDNPYLAKLAPETPVYNTLGYLPDLGIDHIIDVLKDDVATGKLKLEDLNKITMDQAVKRAGEYDFEMAKKARDAAATARESMPVHKEYPEGYKWVQLTKPGEFNAESNAMGHSVRGYEPERGHPDWTPESGDSGREYYGHGGWEAIKSGKAKVYSLVDPSGKPHTTIEVKQNPNPYPVSGEAFASLPPEKKAQYREHVMQWRRRNPDVEELTDDHVTQALKEAGVQPQPDIITQIKGKGNARPQEKYDQYTQDFVRSGNWADVNRSDLRNTGLIQHSGKYFTEPEFVEAAKKYGRMGVQDVPWEVARQRHIDAGVPEEEALLNWVEGLKEGRGRLDIPEEGMKAGGRVNRKHFHEPHLSVGGDLAKIAAKSAKTAKPAAKAAEKAAEYLPGIHYADPLKPPTMKMSEALGITGSEGKTLNFTETDRSRVFGPNRGGTGFSALQHYSLPHKEARTVWGWGKDSVATKKLNINDPENTVWTTYAGSPNQHKSNTLVVKDAIKTLQEADKKGTVHPKQIELINDRIREAKSQNGGLLFPDSFDITDPEAMKYATTFDRRSAISDALMGIGVKKPMISKEFKAKYPGVKWEDASDIDAILRRETDPVMLDANTFDVGPHLFSIDNQIITRPDLNEAFPVQATGTDFGVRYEPVSMRTAAPDWIKARNIQPDEPINAWAMSRAAPSQFVSEDYLTWLQKQGKKAGGLAQAKKPKKVARHGNTVPN